MIGDRALPSFAGGDDFAFRLRLLPILTFHAPQCCLRAKAHILLEFRECLRELFAPIHDTSLLQAVPQTPPTRSRPTSSRLSVLRSIFQPAFFDYRQHEISDELESRRI